MDEPGRHCVTCGVLLAEQKPRWCPACGVEIERRSADRPPASVWRRRRIGLIAAAVAAAVAIAGTVTFLSGQRSTDDTDLGGPADPVDRGAPMEPVDVR